MSDPLTIAIDAMGGDSGPEAVVRGLGVAAVAAPDARFVVCGDSAALEPLLARSPQLTGRFSVSHAPQTVTMEMSARQALRAASSVSMGVALDQVRAGHAHGVVSPGNTGALATLATRRLRTIEGVDRPAIGALWPALTPSGFVVALDMGADLRATPESLTQNAVLGVEYARAALGVARPRVALLNVGSEPEKGPAHIRAAAVQVQAIVAAIDAEFVGYVEGDGVPMGAADVIVADGFSGNVALKSAEGAARLISRYLSDALRGSPWGRLGALIAYPALRKLKRQMDPSQVNGGVILGLSGLVVKSHGSANAAGFATAVALAIRLARGGFAKTLSQSIARAAQAARRPAGGVDAFPTRDQTPQ